MKQIIHVDNSEFFRKLMKSFLSEIGLDCESFESGGDAISAAADGGAAYVITGLELPDMSGADLLKRLVTLPQKVPVIVVTSSNEIAKHKNIEALGVEAIILKTDDWKSALKKILNAE